MLIYSGYLRGFKRHLINKVIFAATIFLAGCTSPGTCQLDEVSNLPVTYFDNLPIVTVQINGKNERMIIDTGAAISFLSIEAIHNAGISTAYHTNIRLMGIGGQGPKISIVIPDIKIGQITVKDGLMDITKNFQTGIGQPHIDGLLGYNVLQAFDIGLDLPDDQIILAFSENCGDVDETPWPGNYTITPLTSGIEPRATIDYYIDDKEFSGQIDTGAARTLVMQSALDRSGIKPTAVANGYVRRMIGYGQQPLLAHLEQFQNITVGAETFDNPWLFVGSSELGKDVDVIIGEDYIRHHRIYISEWKSTAYLSLTIPPKT